MAKRQKVHYNIRHVSAGRPVAYCHAVCEPHETSLHAHEVTCDICCDFIDGFAVAMNGRRTEGAQGGRIGFVLSAAFIASLVAATAFVWKRFL